jgi:hypothetical protein
MSASRAVFPLALEAGEDFAAMGDTGGDTEGDTGGGTGTGSVGTGLGAAAGFAGATGVVDPVGGIDFLEDGVFGFAGVLLSD